MDTSRVGVSFTHEYIGSFQIHTTISYAFYLFTEELQACLILLDDLIVEEGFFIFCEDSLRACIFLHSEIIDKIMKKQLAFLTKCDKI